MVLVWVNKDLYYPSLGARFAQDPTYYPQNPSQKGHIIPKTGGFFLWCISGLLTWVVVKMVKHHFQGIYVLEVSEFCSTVSSDVES